MANDPKTAKKSLFDLAQWEGLADASANGQLVETYKCAKFIETFLKPKIDAVVAFWDRSDLSEKIAMGWRVLTRFHWEEVEQWNGEVAGRHQIQEIEGGLTMGDHGFICFMPRMLAVQQQAKQNQHNREFLAKSLGDIYVSPQLAMVAKAEVEAKRTAPKKIEKDEEVANLLDG